MSRLLIIGYGNPLRGDDGFGYHAAERLRDLIQEPEIEILALHQLTPELMDPLSRADSAIFIDACIGGIPGEIQERTLDPNLPASARFTHHLTPEMLLAGAASLYGRAPESVLITCTGTDFACSLALSQTCKLSLDQTISAVLRHALSRCKLP
jgi:hydrogenase maturation protease